MNDSVAQYPVAVKPPTIRPSARNLWIRDQLLVIHPEKDPNDIKAGIDYLVRQFEQSPVLAIIWWCAEVPKKRFLEKHRLDVWIKLLRHSIDLFVAKNYKRQPKKPGWREKALRGVFCQARKLGKSFSDTEDLWQKFVTRILRESRRDLDCNLLTKVLFQPPSDTKKRRIHFDHFKQLGRFLKDTNPRREIWKGGQDFILSLVSDLNQKELKRLLDNSSSERKIATAAIVSDLKSQHFDYMRQMDIRTPARETLRWLILELGDWDLADRADQELGPLVPTGLTFKHLLEDLHRDHTREKRRPEAKRRYKRRSEEGH